MNASDAKRLTVASIVVTGVLASVKDVSRGQLPRVRIALGLVIAGVTLAALADFAPDLAGSFAALLLVSALVNIGAPVFSQLSKGLK